MGTLLPPELPPELAAKLRPHLEELSKRRSIFSYDRSWQDPVAPTFPTQLLWDMADAIDGARPTAFTSHRPVIGSTIAGFKSFIAALGYRFLKLCLRRQKQFNNYTWTLAYRTMLAEKRLDESEATIKLLKAKLKELEGKIK